MDSYRSSYIDDYSSHPSLGRSPGGSGSPPRHSQGRPSRSSSPVSRQHYHNPGLASPMRRSPREGRSPQHHDYNSRSALHPSETQPYRRDASPPYYRRNLPAQHHDNGVQRRSKAGVPRPTKVKRFLLTRDPKDRRISGNGLGMKVVGGKEIPGTRGRLGAYIARLQPGGVAETLGQLMEGDLLLEWNGVSLVDRTYEEVQSIVTHSVDDVEVEIVARSDINMISGERLTGDRWQSHERGLSPENSSYYANPQRRSDPQAEDPLDINGNRSSSEGPLNDTTGSHSQDIVFGNESRRYEREGGRARQEALGDSSRPGSPRARSSSRHRYQNNSPDARSKPQSSPGMERPTNRELRRVNDDGECGEGASLTPRGSPVPHSSRERRSHNARNRTPEATSGEGTAEAGKTNSDKPARHRSSSAGGGRRFPNPKQPKGTGTTTAAVASTPTAKNQEQLMGEVQLQVLYDSQADILYVTVVRARGLHTVRQDGDTRPDPFIKVYLLPGRSVENQRRTRYFSLTSTPEWNQTMVYPNLRPSELAKRQLEVTAWNYQRDRPNEFLGEIVLDLSELGLMDEAYRWYQLQESEREDLPEQLPE